MATARSPRRVRLFDRLVRLLRWSGSSRWPARHRREDLEQIIAEARQTGQLDSETSRLLDRGLDFRTHTAAEAMMPRVSVTTVDADQPLTEVVALLERTGHARFPVLGPGGVDDIVGVIGVFDVVKVPADRRATTTVGQVAVPPLLLPTTLPLPAVLDRMRRGHRQLPAWWTSRWSASSPRGRGGGAVGPISDEAIDRSRPPPDSRTDPLLQARLRTTRSTPPGELPDSRTRHRSGAARLADGLGDEATGTAREGGRGTGRCPHAAAARRHPSPRTRKSDE